MTVELLAIHVGLVLFSAVLAGRPTIGFVDNEPARHAIIRGTSGILEAAKVVQGICDTEIKLRLLCYWARVPSSSNLADAPSRGEEPEVLPGWPRPLRVPADALLHAELRPDQQSVEAFDAPAFTGCAGRMPWGLRDLRIGARVPQKVYSR